MSKVGKKVINIPSDVYINFIENAFIVSGVLGSFTYTIQPNISILVFCNFLSVFLKNKSRIEHKDQAYFGTIQSILMNAINGVRYGFRKRLLLNGIGYKAFIVNDHLILRVGYSHKIERVIPTTLKVTIENSIIIEIFGIDKQIVSQFAASVISLKPPDSYKGKGIYYDGVSIKLKEVKKK